MAASYTELSDQQVRDGESTTLSSKGKEEDARVLRAEVLGEESKGRADSLDMSDLKEVDIPEDAYGAGILTIVKDLPSIYRKQDVPQSTLQSIFALSLLFINLILQASIVTFIFLHVVQPSVKNVQVEYRDFHAHVFHEGGEFNPDAWEDYDRKAELCQIAMTDPVFYRIVLFLWTLSILQEFRTTQRLFQDVWSMASCNSVADMIRRSDSKTLVQALTPLVRFSLLTIVVLPKMLISGALLVLGWMWLSATTSFEDLVMNAVAMEFVTKIDEMLYDVLLPASHRSQVSDINLVVRRTDKWWYGFARSGMYMILAITLVMVYSTHFQTVLPSDLSDVKLHCAAFKRNAVPICAARFGQPPGLECFPHGHGAAEL